MRAQSEVHPHVYVFADTSSLRFELTVPGAAALAGTVVHARVVSAADSSTLWSGDVGTLAASGDAAKLSGRVSGMKPRRWSPTTPALYYLALDAGTGAQQVSERVRFGFRTMSSANGRILLNGMPLFLRGNAINPPERNIPDSLEENRRFVEPYVRYLKSVGVNIIRLTRHSQVWFDVCDELGMMLFQGNYGAPQGGAPTRAPNRPLAQSIAWYRNDVIGPLVNHPSVVLYVLSNEQADAEIPYLNKGATEIDRFLRAAYDSLHAWDATRLYIANAGYGFGRAGDICDLHRYWGWYYNSFLSFYTLRDPKVCWRTSAVQPMTLTENTGNYTGPDGRFNLVSNTKQPDSQLNWTGHAPEREQAARALSYQAWMAKQAIEITRRTREQNPNLAGLTPFTILFHKWWGISGFDEMRPKPIAAQYGVSYQPVLLTWELWTPQVYAGTTIKPAVHVVNDDSLARDLSGLSIEYRLVDASGAVKLAGRAALPNAKYYEAKSQPLSIELPAALTAGTYALRGSLMRGSDTLSRNETPLFVAPNNYKGVTGAVSRTVKLYDPSGQTARAFAAQGVRATTVRSAAELSPASDLLVIGGKAWDETLARDTAALRAFVRGGGRLIVLHQDPARFNGDWLPVGIRLQTGELDHPLIFPGGRPFRNGMAVNPERPSHPVLDGIDRDRLFLWSDFTNWNESRPGFPQIYPVTQGFVLTAPATMSRVAVLANYDHGLQGIALAELFDGSGSAIVTGFDLVSRAGLDPVADRLLVNLVRYMGGKSAHDAAPLIDSKITWGDYESERGLVTGVYSGLLVNTVPVVPPDLAAKYPTAIDEEGFAIAGGEGGWNTKPAIQYIARGRRAYGPYGFTSGGSVQLPKDHGAAGEGRFWCRVPANRKTMITTVENPIDKPLELEVELNGAVRRVTIAPRSTQRVESPLTGADVAVRFRGDRRLILLETDFR